MTIEQTIQKAIEGGFDPCDLIINYSQAQFKRNDAHKGTWITNPEGDGCFIEDARHLFLNPLFWQSLGNALGWEKKGHMDEDGMEWLDDVWKIKWHLFIDTLSEGKSIESFFEQF